MFLFILYVTYHFFIRKKGWSSYYQLVQVFSDLIIEDTIVSLTCTIWITFNHIPIYFVSMKLYWFYTISGFMVHNEQVIITGIMKQWSSQQCNHIVQSCPLLHHQSPSEYSQQAPHSLPIRAKYGVPVGSLKSHQCSTPVVVVHTHHGLMQDCSNSIADALELLQSCAKPSISCYIGPCCNKTWL